MTTQANPATIRTLGWITLVTAPALLVEAARHGFTLPEPDVTGVLGAVLYGLFAIGWFTAILGLRRIGATGRSGFGRALISIPLVTTVIAAGQSIMDILRVDPASVAYLVTDLAWPLSMVLTFLISVTVLFAGTLHGWHRWVPLFCGISLPLHVAYGAITGDGLPVWVFAAHTALGWALLGWVLVRHDAPRRFRVRRAAVSAV